VQLYNGSNMSKLQNCALHATVLSVTRASLMWHSAPEQWQCLHVGRAVLEASRPRHQETAPSQRSAQNVTHPNRLWALCPTKASPTKIRSSCTSSCHTCDESPVHMSLLKLPFFLMIKELDDSWSWIHWSSRRCTAILVITLLWERELMNPYYAVVLF
jgi:hypothetical protein